MALNVEKGLQYAGVSLSFLTGLSMYPGLSYPAYGGSYALASNRNVLPYTTTTAANYVRHYFQKVTLSNQANWSGFALDYTNFGQNQVTEFAGGDNITIRACILYNGRTYQSTIITLQPSETGRVYFPIFIANVADGTTAEMMILTRVVHSNTANAARIVSIGTQRAFGEGQYTSTDVNDDFTNGSFAYGARAGAVTITGSDITAVAVAAGGQNYTSAYSVYAWQIEVDGTFTEKAIGFITRTGTAVSGITINSGAPPAGKIWQSNVNITIGNNFSATTLVYAPSAILAIPDRLVTSMAILGDSIGRGWSSTDDSGDQFRNFGIYERAIANRFGLINLSTSGGKVNYYADTSLYPRTFAFLARLRLTNAIIALGSNDIFFDSITQSSLRTKLGIIKNRFKTAYSQTAVDFATYIPRMAQKSISAITNANPAVVTSASHNYQNGDIVYIASVGGMTQVNNLQFTVANITANTFELSGIDSTAYGIYTSGGVVGCISNMSRNAAGNGFAAGGTAELINTDIRNGTIVSDRAYVDTHAIFADPSDATRWYVSEGFLTQDLTHPSDIGLGWAGWNSLFSSYFYNLVPITRVLDSYTSSTKGIYGLRRLVGSYNSKVIRLIRASDSLQKDFYAFSTALRPEELTLFLNGTTGKVVTLYDQSSAAVNATQGTDANRPTITLAAKNGQPVVVFNGSSQWLGCNGIATLLVPTSTPSLTLMTLGSRTTVLTSMDTFALAADAVANSLVTVNGGSTSNERFLLRDNAGTLLQPFKSGADTNYHTLFGTCSFISTTATVGLSRDADIITSSTGTQGAMTIDNANIGSRFSNSTRSSYWNGNILEAVAWNITLKPTQISAIYAEQQSFWGL